MTSPCPALLRLASLLLIFNSMGCAADQLTGPMRTSPIQGAFLGAQASALGVEMSAPVGLLPVEDRLLVKWETVAQTAIVAGLAIAWSLDDQQEYVRAGSCLQCLANKTVEKWAPPDSVFVSQHRLGVGGTALFSYRSETLRRSLAPLPDAGQFFVVIVLDSESAHDDLPIVAPSFENQPELGIAMFSVALLSGQPWGKVK